MIVTRMHVCIIERILRVFQMEINDKLLFVRLDCYNYIPQRLVIILSPLLGT